MAALVASVAANATSYTIFDIANPGIWTGDGNGWTTTVNAGGKTFTIKTAKEGSSTTDLISPVTYDNAWRVYKNSSFTISTDVVMKQVVITYDDYESSGTTYYSALTLSEGWTGSLNGVVYTLTSTGLQSIKATAETKQVRIKTVVVSDETGQGDDPITPDLPEGVLYQNNFTDNYDGWTKINDESISDFSGWKINNNTPKCLICNSYYGGAVHAANAKIQREFNLAEASDVKVSFSQAFGYDFPQSQVNEYRFYVINGGTTEYLALANWPAAPEGDKKWTSWANNEIDLSEYDGQTITLGFEYSNDGSKSGAWEIKDFVLSGNGTLGVNHISGETEAAPVYFNLQGVKVVNPVNGVYVKVQGAKVTKVVK